MTNSKDSNALCVVVDSGHDPPIADTVSTEGALAGGLERQASAAWIVQHSQAFRNETD